MTLRQIFATWPAPMKLAWLCTGMVTTLFLYLSTLYWADLDQPTVNRLASQFKILDLLAAPFASETWDRVVVLGGCVYVWLQLIPQLRATPARPLPILGLPMFLVGMLAVGPCAYLFAQIGMRHVLMWVCWAVGWACLAGAILSYFGWRHLNLIRFVVFFSLIALPIPGRLNNPIQTTLQEITTSCAFYGLKATGFTVEREGFVLHMKSGDLGVVEACCGIRSLTSLVAIAAFVAWMKKFSPLRGALLLCLSIPVIILVNGFRVYLTGLLQETVGREWAMGWRHEVVGYAMVFLGLGLILWISKGIATPESEDESPPPSDDQRPTAIHRSYAWSWLLAIIGVLGIASIVYGYTRPVVAKSAIPDGDTLEIEKFSRTLGQWKSKEGEDDIAIDPRITSEMRYNACLHRRYSNQFGYDFDIWIIYWSTAKSVKGYHHPDICMTVRGQEIVVKEQREFKTPGQNLLPITYREFSNPRGTRARVVYWTQEGRFFWTPQDEVDAFKFEYPFRWLQKRMGDRPTDEFDDRIVVLIGSRPDGDKNGKLLEDFVGRTADELYQLLPWAKPK